MDIVETLTQSKADEKQAESHNARVAHYQSLGYTIINNEIVPKNLLTGLDDLTAQRTKIWAVPELTPDNTYEFPKVTDATPVYSGNDQWDYVIRERPSEWSDNMEDMEFNAQWNTPEFK